VDLGDERDDEGPTLTVVQGGEAGGGAADGPARVVIRLWSGAVNGRTRWQWSLASSTSHTGVEAAVRKVLAHTPVPPVDECWEWLAEVLVEAWSSERGSRADRDSLPLLEVEPVRASSLNASR
jgi:hypothetical protein